MAVDCVHPDELLERMTFQQFIEWREFFEVEPWGDDRADQRLAASVLWMLAPVLGGNVDLPSLLYPYFIDEEESLLERASRLAEYAKTLTDGNQLPIPTVDSPGA